MATHCNHVVYISSVGKSWLTIYETCTFVPNRYCSRNCLGILLCFIFKMMSQKSYTHYYELKLLKVFLVLFLIFGLTKSLYERPKYP